MKKLIVGVLFAVAAVGALACDEDPALGFVEGSLTMGGVENPFVFKGTFGDGGTYVGSCEYFPSSDTFKLSMGHGTKAQINSASEVYFTVSGIEGPAEAGTYDGSGAAVPKWESTDVEKGTFTSAVIKNGGNEFPATDLDENANCWVNQFSKAASGEVTPIAQAAFEYYVSFHCVGSWETITSGGTTLTSFDGEFYVKGCK